jgi:hypothetical protein
MDLGTVGWIVIGWLAVAPVLSLALGSFLRKANEAPGVDDFAVTATRQNVVTYMRGRKPVNTRANARVPQVHEMGRRAAG